MIHIPILIYATSPSVSPLLGKPPWDSIARPKNSRGWTVAHASLARNSAAAKLTRLLKPKPLCIPQHEF